MLSMASREAASRISLLSKAIIGAAFMEASKLFAGAAMAFFLLANGIPIAIFEAPPIFGAALIAIIGAAALSILLDSGAARRVIVGFIPVMSVTSSS